MRFLRAGEVIGFLLLCGAPACTASAAEVQNRLVAVVNDEVVTLYELNERIRLMTRKDPGELREQDEGAFLRIRREVLNGLIEEKLAQGKVKELGIRVSPKEVDAAIERIKENNSMTQDDLLAVLQKDGMNYEDYRESVRAQIERMKLINAEVKSRIVVREELVEEYYNKHKSDFLVDEEVHLASIFLIDKGSGIPGSRRMLLEKAESIVERLKSGEDFAAIAAAVSEGPGSEEGGDLGVFKTSELNDTLKERVRGMPVGGVSDPIPIPSGYQILKLLDRREGRVRPPEEVKEAIYERLYTAEMEDRYAEWIQDLREKSYVKIIF